MLYLTISEGKSAATATPVVASKDPCIVEAVLEAIARRLGRITVPTAVLKPDKPNRASSANRSRWREAQGFNGISVLSTPTIHERP